MQPVRRRISRIPSFLTKCRPTNLSPLLHPTTSVLPSSLCANEPRLRGHPDNAPGGPLFNRRTWSSFTRRRQRRSRIRVKAGAPSRSPSVRGRRGDTGAPVARQRGGRPRRRDAPAESTGVPAHHRSCGREGVNAHEPRHGDGTRPGKDDARAGGAGHAPQTEPAEPEAVSGDRTRPQQAKGPPRAGVAWRGGAQRQRCQRERPRVSTVRCRRTAEFYSRRGRCLHAEAEAKAS